MLCTVHTAHDVAPQDHSQRQPTHPGRTPHAVGYGLILVMMGIMMSETCWDRCLIINIELFASCWFSLFTLYCPSCQVTVVMLATNIEIISTLKLINPLNAELNSIYHLLTLLGAHHILHISRIGFRTHSCRLDLLNLKVRCRRTVCGGGLRERSFYD